LIIGLSAKRSPANNPTTKAPANSTNCNHTAMVSTIKTTDPMVALTHFLTRNLKLEPFVKIPALF
jgi:hypothetical protein